MTVLATQAAAPGTVRHVTIDTWESWIRCAGFTTPVVVTDAAWQAAGMADKTRCFVTLRAAYVTALDAARELMDADERMARICHMDDSPVLTPLFRDGQARALLFSVASDGRHRPAMLLVTTTADPEPRVTISVFGEGE